MLSHAFGTGGPRVKYSSGGSRLERTAAALASNPVAVSTFNSNYSDAGLFGFHVVAKSNDVGKVRNLLIILKVFCILVILITLKKISNSKIKILREMINF